MGLTCGSRLTERKPLQAVATMKVVKLNQMRGMRSMLRTVIFLSGRWGSHMI